MQTHVSSLQRLRQSWKNNRRNWLLWTGYAALVAGLSSTPLVSNQIRQSAVFIVAPPALGALPVVPEKMRWGLAIDEFHLIEDELKRGDVLGEILLKQGVSSAAIHQLVQNCRDTFRISSMRIGKKLYFLSAAPGEKPTRMIYEPSPYEYVSFQLTEPYQVETVKRAVQTNIVSSAGVLETSFWQALTDNGLNDELADGMIDVLASSVDFYHQKQGDRFKMVYEQHIVEGEAVGTGKILAAVYEREGKQYYAFNYEQPGERTNYFDFDGRPARKAFLKSPVKFSRISSRYSLNRMHPILGFSRPHFGTDYAAPHGTPILSVADGTVTEATRRGGNGIFVKIRHNAEYESQYLHMSSFAKGMRPGTRVVQGQTIGYVGSTGLATGPHVCFRFWKSGRQVDHTRLDLPSAEPMTGAALAQFKAARDQHMALLDGVAYRTRAEIMQAREQQKKPNP